MRRPFILASFLLVMGLVAPLHAVSNCPGLCQSGGTVCVQMFITEWQCFSVEVMGSTLCSQWDEPCYLTAETTGEYDDVQLAEGGKAVDEKGQRRMCQPPVSLSGSEGSDSSDARQIEVSEPQLVPART